MEASDGDGSTMHSVVSPMFPMDVPSVNTTPTVPNTVHARGGPGGITTGTGTMLGPGVTRTVTVPPAPGGGVHASVSVTVAM